MIERKARQIAAHLVEQRLARENLLVELRRNFVAGIEPAVGSVVEPVRNLVNFVDGDAGLVEAEADGVDGKVAGVLFAAEALLLGRGNQFAVDDQRGRGVHALGDAVLALVQARPMRLLEGHRVFQPADPDDFHSCSHATDAPRKFLLRATRRSPRPPACWG